MYADIRKPAYTEGMKTAQEAAIALDVLRLVKSGIEAARCETVADVHDLLDGMIEGAESHVRQA